MEVDAAICGIAEDEAGGALVFTEHEAERGEGFLGALGVIQGDHEIEVVVVAGLFAEEGVDAPSTVSHTGMLTKASVSRRRRTSAWSIIGR